MDGGGRGPLKPVISYYLIRGAGSAHEMQSALCLLPAHLLVFPTLSKILEVWPWVPRTDFQMDGMLLSKVTENSEVEPGTRFRSARKARRDEHRPGAHSNGATRSLELVCSGPTRLSRELGAPVRQAVPALLLSPSPWEAMHREKLCSCPRRGSEKHVPTRGG